MAHPATPDIKYFFPVRGEASPSDLSIPHREGTNIEAAVAAALFVRNSRRVIIAVKI
jgi:hypothetical protein